MDRERWQKIHAIFESALFVPAERIPAYLETECRGDALMRREIELLLSQRSTVQLPQPPEVGAAVARAEAEFTGSERFVVQRRLGSGGFGVVYQVYDRFRDAVLALKTLRRIEAVSLIQFKNEFRVLADIIHPNLVTLYELLQEEGRWFFTMELVDGADFLEHARALGEDFDSLRKCMRQLADGVAAVHAYGKLHCDLKPSNVLVDLSSRVRILDFGLMTDIATHGQGSPVRFGTRGYMSPEQAGGLPLSPAADWYSFGVMLYQALTGRFPPAASSPNQPGRRTIDPSSIAAVRPNAPEDLCDLAAALLRSDPLLRPSGFQVLRALGMPRDEAMRIAWFDAAPLIGRESELATLRAALRAAEDGRPATVLIHGPSGVGKTAVARHFLKEVRETGRHLVLEGRCHERESAPYKALDPLVDNLNRYLAGLSPAARQPLLPVDFAALTRLFPVLESLAEPLSPIEIANAAELRLRGFQSLHNLLKRLAAIQPLVLLIDDLQWGDLDSSAFLLDLVSDPDPARILFLACYRSEEADSSPLLRQLLNAHRPMASAQRVELPLRDLEFDIARNLARSLLSRHEPAAASIVEKVAHESGGNPFFLAELVKQWQTGPRLEGEQPSAAPGDAPSITRSISFEDLLRRRLASLPEGARRLLEVIALAGQPIDLAIAKDAARLDRGAYTELAQLLRQRLVRTRRSESSEEIEAYHDRIRQGAEAFLPADAVRDYHYRLAVAWESAGRSTPGFLAIHFRAAGISDKALDYSIRAAGEAAATLAFDNAAQFYGFAVELAPESQRDAWRVKLGEALCNAGRGAEGARVYRDVAARSSGVESIELRRRAAAHFLMAGRMEEGLTLVREVLKVVRMTVPRWAWQALVSFLFWRLWIRMRGLRFRERPASAVSAITLLRIDVCSSLVQGLAMVDPIRAHPFHARLLLLAVQCGELSRISRAFCSEAAYFALRGGRESSRVESLLMSAQDLAIRSGSDNARGLVALAKGMAAFLQGEWRSALERMTAAETILRERCTGVAWEVATAHMMGSVSLFLMGDWKELKYRLPRIIKDAEARGDLFEATDLRTRLAHSICLAADRPEQARREIRDAMAEWRREDFDLQHWWAWLGNVETDLYEGEGRAAWLRVGSEWSRLRWSFLTRVQYVYLESLHHRARAALALASGGSTGGERRDLLHRVDRDIHRMEREGRPWASALATLLRAGVRAAEGVPEGAVQLLERAEREFAACDMNLYAATTRLLRGNLIGGDQGSKLSACAKGWMQNQQIVNPERVVTMLAPGFRLARTSSR